MEPVGAACAAAQFIGLAAQAIQAISWARQKFKDIKSAPKLIKQIHHELKVFESTLIQLSSIDESRFSDDAARSFSNTLVDCVDIFENLWLELGRHDFDQPETGLKRLWKQILANEKRWEFESYLKRLESAKASLKLTMGGMQLEMTTDFRNLYTAHVQNVEDSLSRLETGVSSVQTLSEKIHENTTMTINRVEAVADLITQVDRSLQDMRTDLPALIEQGIESCLDKRLAGWMKDTVVHRSIKALEDHTLPSSSTHLKSPCNRSTLQALDHVRLELSTTSISQPYAQSSKDIGPSTPSTKRNTEWLRIGHKSDQVTIRRKTYTRNITLPVGFVQMKTVQRVCRDIPDSGNIISERETVRLDITFLPFRCLSTRGQIISIEKRFDAHNRHFWTYTPRIYNRLSNDAMIVQACKQRDIDAVKKLFQYQKASPFDTCSDGSSLMILTFNSLSMGCYEHHWEKALEVIRFLISQGADPTIFVAEYLQQYSPVTGGCFSAEMLEPEANPEVFPTHYLEKIWQTCLASCHSDPFADPKVLELLWDNSLGGKCIPPIDPASLFHDTHTGFESLICENPDKVFSDLMDDANYIGSGSDMSWQRLVDQKYETLTYLCIGGSESSKAKVFSQPSLASAPRQPDTCFCPETSSHLLFKLLHRTQIWTCRTHRQKALLQHLYRMLIILLESGEDPEATCGCHTDWQSEGEHRTATDVAASEAVLKLWRKALEDCGFDATAIIEGCLYDGISSLFGTPQSTPTTFAAPLRLVGNIVQVALSSIV